MATRDIIEYGIGGFDPSKPNNNVISRKTEEVAPEETNADQVRSKLIEGLQANRDFISLSNPTAAQTAAQVRRLTRQTNALIRLTLQLFADASDV
jgi:hypothetical protein